MDYAVKTNNLTKAYKGKTVVDNVNLHIKKGEIYGFVGPNGAGKSTIMKMLLNLVKPDFGEVTILGSRMEENSFECLKRIGSIIENPYFYEKMTGRENLELHCEYMGYYNRDRVNEVLERVGLKDTEKKSVIHYSLGMKQRLAIARAILTKPELLILDEPINALDPEGIKEMRSLFYRLSKDCGTTIFISSHILSEVEQIADTIGIIRNGKLIEEVSIDTIHEFHTDYLEVNVNDVNKASYLLEQSGIVSNFVVNSDHIIKVFDSGVSGSDISDILVKNNVRLESIGQKKSTLEDYFFNLSGEE